MRRRMGPLKPEDIEEMGDIELSEEESDTFQAKIDQAEKDIDARRQEARFNCRWNKASLAVIQEVAEAMGVPYQTYIKMVAYRAAIADRNSIHARLQGSMPPPLPGPGDYLRNYDPSVPAVPQVAENSPPPPAPKKSKKAG